MYQVTAPPAASPLKRRSCDRCHAQKLRCHRRGGNDNDNCSRCLRAGSPCVYSAPLPKGRPSAYRKAGGIIIPGSSPVPLGTPVPYQRPLAGISPEPISDPTAHFTPGWDNRIFANPRTISATSPDMAAPCGTISTAWPSSDDTAFLQSSVQLDWNGPLFSSLSGLASPSNLGLVADLPMTPATGDAETERMVEAVGGGTTLVSSANITSSTADFTPLSIPGSPSSNSHETLVHCLPRSYPQAVDETEIAIGRLSELSVRLYPIYKMTSAWQEQTGVLLSGAAYDAVNVFLLEETRATKGPIKNGCDTLHETFSTSCSLLDIMYQLQATADIAANTANGRSSQKPTSTLLNPALPTVDSASVNDNWMNLLSGWTSPYSATVSLSPHPAVSASTNESLDRESISNGPFDVSLSYLVLACYTRVLQIYGPIITILQFSVSHGRMIEPRSRTWMAELKISLLAQFIVQIFNRLQQATKAYLPQVDERFDIGRMAPAAPWSETQSYHPDKDLVGLGNVADVESIVREKLKQLQTTLQG